MAAADTAPVPSPRTSIGLAPVRNVLRAPLARSIRDRAPSRPFATSSALPAYATLCRAGPVAKEPWMLPSSGATW